MKNTVRKTESPFTRGELAAIRDRAVAVAGNPCLLDGWRRAFWALADAADRLDLMAARDAATPES